MLLDKYFKEGIDSIVTTKLREARKGADAMEEKLLDTVIYPAVRKSLYDPVVLADNAKLISTSFDAIQNILTNLTKSEMNNPIIDSLESAMNAYKPAPMTDHRNHALRGTYTRLKIMVGEDMYNIFTAKLVRPISDSILSVAHMDVVSRKAYVELDPNALTTQELQSLEEYKTLKHTLRKTRNALQEALNQLQKVRTLEQMKEIDNLWPLLKNSQRVNDLIKGRQHALDQRAEQRKLAAEKKEAYLKDAREQAAKLRKQELEAIKNGTAPPQTPPVPTEAINVGILGALAAFNGGKNDGN